MAMNKAAMADAILTEMKTLNPNITGAQEAELKTYLEAFTAGIINHIQANAVVNVTGVQTGGGSATGEVQ